MATRRKDGERYPSGKLIPKRPALGPLALERRKALYGDRDAATEFAGHPLGVHKLRGLLTDADYRAGLEFAMLWHSVFGNGRVPCHLEQLVYGARGSGGDADAWEKIKRDRASRLGAAIKVLQSLPTRFPYNALLTVAVHEYWPRYLDPQPKNPRQQKIDERDLAALQEATDALVTHFGMSKRAAA